VRVVRVAAATTTAVVIAAACGGGSGHKAKNAVTTTSTAKTAQAAAVPPTAPLTGLPDPSGKSQTRPALDVKIENTPAARPQTGLDAADVVYEEVVDGGITRFLAIYNSTSPPVVGPVRSVRGIDPQLVSPVGGVFVYSGGAAQEIARIRTAPVVLVDESAAGGAMYRDHSRRSPHNLYARPDQLFGRGGKPVPPPPLFQYLGAGAVFNGQPASSFTVNQSPDRGYDPTYTWDAASGTWKRSYGGTPFTMTDGTQVAPTNVVVQATVYTPAPGAAGAVGQTVGQGQVWVFSGGKVAEGTWSRSNVNAPTRYTDANGAPILLTPGRTWVELAMNGGGVNVSP
jgi:hypothetical protein